MALSRTNRLLPVNGEPKYGFIIAVTIIAALGGFLFGYDWVVIGGAKPFYEAYFGLIAPTEIAWAMSGALVGCLVGAAVSGHMADKLGRKKALIIAGLFFALSAIFTALAQSFAFFVLMRMVGGVAIGLASTISPLYIAEIAPSKHRGRLVAVNQLTIVLGILAAQICNLLIADSLPEQATHTMILESWNGQSGWRWMFGVEALPALVFLVLVFFIPESPRWLIKQHRMSEAFSVLSALGGRRYADEQTAVIKATFANDDGKFDLKELLGQRVRPILTIGIALAVFQQWCGINVIFNYAHEVFGGAGYDTSQLLYYIVFTGSANLVFTLVALKTVDKWGRKTLLAIGSGALAFIYLLLAIFYYTQIVGWHMLVLVISAISFFAVSLAPVTWIYLSEIFPNRIRDVAMSICVFSLWAASFILTYTFPILNDSLGEGSQGTAMTFAIYAVICVVGCILISKKLPETKGKSLEELEHALGTSIDKVRKDSF